MDEVVGQAYHQIHKFMFDNVYRNPQAKEEETKSAQSDSNTV